jgi:hypothetical protein
MMNPRIKEIALECYNPYGNFDLEKFAQLIVRECSIICKESGDVPAVLVSEDILLHFGVKE